MGLGGVDNLEQVRTKIRAYRVLVLAELGVQNLEEKDIQEIDTALDKLMAMLLDHGYAAVVAVSILGMAMQEVTDAL